ncbi:isoleucine--tRNA ligase [Alphaproteobacteria bacterium]|nr:isoleucine--tRNA ligase [Alphaproteobacteria bacterium]
MRANLPALEKDILERWEKINLHGSIKEQSKGRDLFVLHDGPPYANGHLHLGHALNKTLKDVVIKYKRLQGKKVPYVPGWDCHGLPIEWKIEESYRAQKKDKDAVPILEFRQECRSFAQKWVDTQKKEFKRLGILGDWDTPYLTMTNEAEAGIVKQLHTVMMQGNLYKGLRPVQWSVIEKTALAEAEIEYKEKTSSSIHVLFPFVNTEGSDLENVSALIWTTTPWTIPANRAIAYLEKATYAIVQGENTVKFLVAQDLISSLEKEMSMVLTILKTLKGSDLKGIKAHHPFHSLGYDFEVPLLAGDHVTLDQGTGLVHTAPSHGVEDFELGKQHNLEIPELIGGDGLYYDHVPLFGGHHVFKADKVVIEKLIDQKSLLNESKITHSYPHSWRSKAPLIYRTTSQWFISMEHDDLRKKALKNIEKVSWYPQQGKNRLASMVKGRPDWCLSRQRSWGVPIALFVSKKTGLPLRDSEVNDRIYKAMQTEGADAWYAKSPQEFLGKKYNASDFEQVTDILDVWFESGTSHAFVLENHPDLKWPADLYLEGLDQHRGWFQSSLLHSTATKDSAPYKSVFTHGFVVDENGYKMSKSVGNTVNLDDVLEKHGADILRLWVIGSDYFDDLRIGDEIIKRQKDIYRKIRNTFRFLLGNLSEFSEKKSVEYTHLPELEKWILHRLSELDEKVRKDISTYDFHSLFTHLYAFCVNDLSAFYFDIRKDSLYCDDQKSKDRLSVQTVLHTVFRYLCKWLAPILTFTIEEAWTTYFPESSIFLQTFDGIPPQWHQPSLGSKYKLLRNIRRVVTGAIEEKRAKGEIKSSLQAQVTIAVKDSEVLDYLNSIPLADFCITSAATVECKDPPKDAYVIEDVENVAVSVNEAPGNKCVRCWKILPEVDHSEICLRCKEAVKNLEDA